jgi:hypothetical protein
MGQNQHFLRTANALKEHTEYGKLQPFVTHVILIAMIANNKSFNSTGILMHWAQIFSIWHGRGQISFTFYDLIHPWPPS